MKRARNINIVTIYLQDAHFPAVVFPLVKATLLSEVVVILICPVAATYKIFQIWRALLYIARAIRTLTVHTVNNIP
jgi:hypothetical protein